LSAEVPVDSERAGSGDAAAQNTPVVTADPSEAASGARKLPAPMVTLRSVLLALLLIPINAFWVVTMEVTRYQGHPTTISVFFNVVFVFAVLLLLNGIARRINPRLALHPGELLTIYVMLALATAITGHDMIEVLTPILAHVHYFARPENGWISDILPHVPKWLTVSDKDAITQFYLGTGSLYQPHNLLSWAGPVMIWTTFLSVLCFIMLCINTILRRQWTENERLAYPLVQLPLELVNPKTQMFRSKLFWYGVAVSAVLEMWNGLAYLYPSIPMLPLKRFGAMQDLNTYVTSPPWNAMGWTPIAIYPFGIALGMLLPVDLLFSCWFFSWVWRFERIIGAMYNFNDIPGFPYTESQSFGCYIGLALFALWTSRSRLIYIAKSFFDRSVDLQDANEPLPYRVAILGILIGSGSVFWFCHAAGMSSFMIVAFFTIYFTLAIAITRMRAELGPPAHDLHHAGPDSIITVVSGTGHMARPDLAMFSLFYGFNRAYRSHPMPIQLEGFKITERTGGRYRPMLFAMLTAIVVGAICGFWANIDQGYRFGASVKIAPPNVMMVFGGEPWDRMRTWIVAPLSVQQQYNNRIAIGVGLLFTLLLNMLRLRLPWFPFHPVGYAVSSSWSLSLLWLPLMIAWGIKLTLLRYGGLKAYRQALPFFFGVILAECVLGSVWALIGIIFKIPTYAFWP
jgi:hypothetical protein